MNCNPLSFAREGQKFLLSRVSGGAETQNRLASLGLIPGAELFVIQRNLSGSFIVSLREGRLALGREMVRCLWGW
jgi:ferrous iron transport protein A